MKRSDVVAVVPAFECARTVGAVAAGLVAQLERVVVVDDGSSDATAAEAAMAGADVVRHERNLGKGAALATGIRSALTGRCEAIALLDADGQHDPRDLPVLLAAWDARRPDLVIGARLHDAERIPPARFWTNYIGSRILSRMTGFELDDSQSGYRLLATALARRLRLVSTGYAVESEMLIKAAALGARLEHVKIRTIYNGAGSHFQPVRDTFRISCASVYFKVFDEG